MAAKSSKSLRVPTFKKKDGTEVKFQTPEEGGPIEKFTKMPMSGFTRLGATESTYIICPKSTIKDAEKAGIDLDSPFGFKDYLTWKKKRVKREVKLFHAEMEEGKLIWILDKDTGIQPNDFVCLPYEGLKEK